jgi:hypothetical protein
MLRVHRQKLRFVIDIEFVTDEKFAAMASFPDLKLKVNGES